MEKYNIRGAITGNSVAVKVFREKRPAPFALVLYFFAGSPFFSTAYDKYPSLVSFFFSRFSSGKWKYFVFRRGKTLLHGRDPLSYVCGSLLKYLNKNNVGFGSSLRVDN